MGAKRPTLTGRVGQLEQRVGRAEQVLVHFLSQHLAASLADDGDRVRAEARAGGESSEEGCSCPAPGLVVALSCEAHGRARPRGGSGSPS